ncbi:hypothetical protein [Streptomyces sp. NPDC001492]
MTTATRVELRIRRLVWDAVDPPSPAALCAAVEAELGVLLGNSPTADAVDRAVPAGSALTAHARRIALAVHEALRAEQRPNAHHRSLHLAPCPTPDAKPTPGPRPEAGAPTP